MASSSTSSSSDATRRRWLPWGGLALALMALLGALATAPDAGWKRHRYARKVVSEQWRRADLLIVGDSRVESGIVPEVLADGRARTRVYNAGIPSLSARGLAELLGRFPTDADELWIGLSPPMFRAHNRRTTVRWFDHAASPELSTRLSGWTAFRSWVELRLAAPWIRLQTHLQRIPPRKSPIGHLREVLFQSSATAPPWMHYAPGSGFLAYRRPFPGDLGDHLQANRHRYRGSFDDGGLEALLDRADALRTRGVAIEFLRLPVHERFRVLEAADQRFAERVPKRIRERGHAWIDFSDASGRGYAFLDGHHLLESSARRFTHHARRWIEGGRLRAALAP